MRLSKVSKEVFCSSCGNSVGYWWCVHSKIDLVLFCSKNCLADSLIQPRKDDNEKELKENNHQTLEGKTFIVTNRQYEICELVKDGLTNNEIAQILGISQKTVETHMKILLQEFDLSNRTQLAKMCSENVLSVKHPKNIEMYGIAKRDRLHKKMA